MTDAAKSSARGYRPPNSDLVLTPGGSVKTIDLPLPRPCITILIHGVNDLAGVYADIEQGLCQGLTERLDRSAYAASVLRPASYTLPNRSNRMTLDPDAVFYRRQGTTAVGGGMPASVVIPFYWGFREDDGVDSETKKRYLQKDTPHGEWLDRYGNRLDKTGSKEGGMFANATTTLPDMWSEGFSGTLVGIPVNPMFGSPGHPLMKAPGRRYMVLAAQRLAALVRSIRKRNPDDTVNVVGHSQGTMITLLANAMLKDHGERPVDGAVFMNSPYSLVESWSEGTQMSVLQQTSAARVATLGGIVKFIGEKPHEAPAFSSLADRCAKACLSGPRWGDKACKLSIDGKEVPYTERDNRGHVTLYFTPQDQTVGMLNVQGIGWQGVSDNVTYSFDDPRQPVTPGVFVKRTVGRLGGHHFDTTIPALPALGPRFAQRVFTLRQRDGKPEEVGKPPTYTYVLKGDSYLGMTGETTWEGSGMDWSRKIGGNAELQDRQSVTIAAGALPVTFTPSFGRSGSTPGTRMDSQASGGVAPVRAPDDPIDAAIAVTNEGINPLESRVVGTPPNVPGMNTKIPAARDYEEQLPGNQGKVNPYTATTIEARNAAAADWQRVTVTSVDREGFYQRVTTMESPNQARQRRMNAPLKDQDGISFHSAISANPEHSRRALAYDVAIGQARSLEDPAFYAYLCRVADWRLGWNKANLDSGKGAKKDIGNGTLSDTASETDFAFLAQEPADIRALIQATAAYRQNGKLPTTAHDAPLPGLVATQTVYERDKGKPVRMGGVPPSLKPL
ncbi:T6SS effector phospholipase Tle3 domain-containing protein [Paraburkholderia tropica]|uniref:T6SS effector phospholipase Tle3 domain-containing protein n=1 Tax=Paraburkholderia tropica TaxID=92647 RepID=UPI002AAF7F84|nr:DUF3274 domain-containing protein [Paraburkholderia tropica]